MAYVRNKFIDPRGVIPDYVWQVNHSEEDANTLSRNIERTTTTDGVGFVRQQGEASPVVFRWTGTILHQNQILTFLEYYTMCDSQTIYLRDFTGAKYEVLITNFTYQRHRTVRNPRDTSIPLHYWTYSIEIEVIAYLGTDMG